MSFRYDEKLPTFKFDLVTTNLKDDNKNCTKSENLKQLYGNYGVQTHFLAICIHFVVFFFFFFTSTKKIKTKY